MYLLCPTCDKRTEISLPAPDPMEFGCDCKPFKMRPGMALTRADEPDCSCAVAQRYRSIRNGRRPINTYIPDIGCMICGGTGYRNGR